MKKINLSIFIFLSTFLFMCIGLGLWVEHGQLPPNGPPLELINRGKYLQTSGVVAELKSEGYLYSGDYPKVINLLQDRSLTVEEIRRLMQAELAEHQDEHVLRLLRQFYELPEAAGYWGIYLADQGYLDGAAEVLQQAANGAGQQEFFQLGLAKLMLQQGNPAKAASILGAIRQTDSNSPYLAVVEGDAALAREDYPTAWQEYKEAIDKGHLKDDPRFLTQYGLAAIGAEQNVDGVVQELGKAAPLSGMNDYLEAQVYLRQGEWAKAAAKLQAALSQPRFPAELKGPVSSLANEVKTRLRAEPALQAIVARKGDV